MENHISEKELDIVVDKLRQHIKGNYRKEFGVRSFDLRSDYTASDVQNVALYMAADVGLLDYTVTVKLDDLKRNIPQYSNYNSDRTLYIVLDKNRFLHQMYPPAQIMTIIAHELCYKLLWVYGLREISSEKKYISDVCAVYVGFGRILMRGMEHIKKETIGNCYYISTSNVGYLEKWQIAYLRNKIHHKPIAIQHYKWFPAFRNIAAIIGMLLFVSFFIYYFFFR